MIFTRAPAFLLGLLLAVAVSAATDPATELAERLLFQARKTLEAEDYPRSAQLLEQVLGLRGAPGAAHGRAAMLLAWLRAQDGNNTAAVDLFGQAADNPALGDEERRQARLAAASLLLSQGQPQAALDRLALQGLNTEERILRGRALLRLQRHAEAVQQLRTGLDELRRDGRPIDAAVRLELAAAYQGLRQWRAASGQMRELLADSPGHGEWWWLLGELELLDDRPRQAAAAWETALTTGAARTDRRRRLAQLYLNLELPSKALAAIQPTIDAQPESMALAAAAHQRLRQPAEALQWWRRAAAQSGDRSYRLAEARLLSELERWPEADQAWQKLAADVTGSDLSGDDLLLAAISAFRNDGADRALALLDRLPAGSRLGDSARQWRDYIAGVAGR